MTTQPGPIVVFSSGMGQDSEYLLRVLCDSAQPDVYRKYVGDAQLVVVHADTMNEHSETIAHRRVVADVCAKHGWTYLEIHPHDGYHTGAWREGLVGQWQRHNSIGSVAYPMTCSDSLKIQPIWKRISAFLAQRFGVADVRKQPLYEHLRKYGRIRTLIGLARGEESRIANDAQLSLLPSQEGCVWMTKCVEKVYPLMELGVDRAGAQAYLRDHDLPIPRPSNCRFCAFKSHAEVQYMALTDPEGLAMWLALERRKRETHNDPANYGVKGRQTLEAFCAEAERRYGNHSIEELREYVWSHGHCLKTKH